LRQPRVSRDPTPGQTKSNQIKPNQTKSNQIKPNQTKSNQIKPNQTRSQHSRVGQPNQTKSNQIKPNQTKSNQIKPDRNTAGLQPGWSATSFGGQSVTAMKGQGKQAASGLKRGAEQVGLETTRPEALRARHDDDIGDMFRLGAESSLAGRSPAPAGAEAPPQGSEQGQSATFPTSLE
jgi:hypothetical protein